MAYKTLTIFYKHIFTLRFNAMMQTLQIRDEGIEFLTEAWGLNHSPPIGSGNFILKRSNLTNN